MKVKIHREGLNIIFGLLFILVVINAPAYIFIRPLEIPITFLVISAIFFLLVVNFFRSPRRHFKGNMHKAVVSSVDGKVVALEEVYEDEFLHSKAIQLSVFMSVFNVHANWFPINGKILYVKHHSGRFMAAYLPKSSTENERSTIAIEAENGQKLVIRQVAGAVARRIVTYAQEGEDAHIDEHLGFIKFGSRVDIYLPLDAEVKVKIGDLTIGGITEIAKLK
ncbi:MAG: phosphatidylserine decarboxylase family protein [Muribaculaceae bacterium]|nr:phosphatidylserine decarboxylase family protein [Muribaculaceae bacterium]